MLYVCDLSYNLHVIEALTIPIVRFRGALYIVPTIDHEQALLQTWHTLTSILMCFT